MLTLTLLTILYVFFADLTVVKRNITCRDVRLNTGGTIGRLEVYYSGEWGTVCDDGFADVEAKVACRSLGYGSGESLGNKVRPGSGRIWMDNVACTGTESSLPHCIFRGWGTHDCTHSEDVGVRCYNKVNGGWSTWYSWTSCSSSSCGVGIKSRYRRCNNPVPNKGGYDCYGLPFESRTCVSSSCQVYGGWSAWYSWTSCSSSSCGVGIKSRYRKCNNPVPKYAVYYCSGLPYESRTCASSSCRVHGGWSAWTSWSSCSSTCSPGKRYRYKRCNNPVPNHGGSSCSGSPLQTQTCGSSSCQENGGWSTWLYWSNCSSTRGDTRYRYRYCTNQVPNNEGSYCSGLPFDTQICNSTGWEGQYSIKDKGKCCSVGTVVGVLVGCVVLSIISVGLFFIIRRRVKFLAIKKDQRSSEIYDNIDQLPPRQSYDNVVYTTDSDFVGVILTETTDETCVQQAPYENCQF